MGKTRHRGAEAVHQHGLAGAGSSGAPGARWHCLPWWLAWRPAPAWASFRLLWKTRGEQVKPQSTTLQQSPAIFKTISTLKQSMGCPGLPRKGRLAQSRWTYLWPSISSRTSFHPFCWSWWHTFAGLCPHLSQLFVKWHEDQQHWPWLPTALRMKGDAEVLLCSSGSSPAKARRAQSQAATTSVYQPNRACLSKLHFLWFPPPPLNNK